MLWQPATQHQAIPPGIPRCRLTCRNRWQRVESGKRGSTEEDPVYAPLVPSNATRISRSWEWSAQDAGVDARSRSRQATRQSVSYDRMVEQYQADGRSAVVDFRALIGPLPADEQTHGVYPYPARLLRHIPRFLLGCEQLAIPDDMVLDPFCGSGTVLLEALGWGHRAIGLDTNPLAVLVSRVKVQPLQAHHAQEAASELVKRAKGLRAPRPAATFLRKWYAPSAHEVLEKLTAALPELDVDPRVLDQLQLSVALLADSASNRDPRVPVPVRSKLPVRHAELDPLQYFAAFLRHVERVSQAGARLPKVLADRARVTLADVRHAVQVVAPPGTAGLIITSPPYGSAQKYVRSCSLGLGWLGEAENSGTALLERASIGREHLRAGEVAAWPVRRSWPTSVTDTLASVYERSGPRAALYAHYFADMADAFVGAVPALRVGGKFVLIAGANTVAGQQVATHALLSEMLAARGDMRLELVVSNRIRSRQLLTKRGRSAPPIADEYIYVFEKRV